MFYLAETLWKNSGCQAEKPSGAIDRHLVHMNAFDNAGPSVSYNSTGFKECLVRFVLMNNLPYNIVSSKDFQLLLDVTRNLNHRPQDAVLPCPNTLSTNIDSKRKMLHSAVKDLLAQQHKISFTVDAWSGGGSNGSSEYLAIVAHFIYAEFKPQQLLIGFEVLDNSHTGNEQNVIKKMKEETKKFVGAYMASKFLSVLKEFQCIDKLHTITSDSAANMKTMMQCISDIPNCNFVYPRDWIPCFAHVVNTAVQDLLKKGLGTKAPSTDDSVYDLAERLQQQNSAPPLPEEDSCIERLRKGIIKIR